MDEPNEKKMRKSSRLCEKQTRVDSGKYFDAENHQFVDNQEIATKPHQDSTSVPSSILDELSIYDTSNIGTSRIVPEFEAKFSAGQVKGSPVDHTQYSQSSQGSQEPSDGSSELCRNPISPVGWTGRKSIANVNENYLRNSKRSAKLGMFD